MKQILVYADSLSWGIIPNSRHRLPFDDRWPGVLENTLNAQEQLYRVIENCLNGRRTVWEDPFKPGRNGLLGIGQVIEMHSPLDLVILMLGTNDYQSMHPHNALNSAQGISAIITAIREAPVEPGMPVPPILIVIPPPIQSPRGTMAAKFKGGELRCQGISQAYRAIARLHECACFDAGKVIAASQIDGIHLDLAEHHILGKSLAEKVVEMIG
jgi:lysophospholipase L1-like esterase